jgi:signal transduction histidine kinase
MRPFRALGNLLHRTPWWLLLSTGVVAIGINIGALIPRNTLKVESAGELAGLQKAIQAEIETAYQRETLRTLLKAVAAVKPSVNQESVQQAEEAIDELHDLKLSLAEAKVRVEEAKNLAVEPSELEGLKAEVERLRQQSSEVGIRLGQIMERVFSGGPVRAERQAPDANGKEGVKISIFESDADKPDAAKGSPTKKAPDGAPAQPVQDIRRGDNKEVVVLSDGTTLLKKPGKEIRIAKDGSVVVVRTSENLGEDSPPPARSKPAPGAPKAPSPPSPPLPPSRATSPGAPASPAALPLPPDAPPTLDEAPTVLKLGNKEYFIDSGIPQELRDDIQAGIKRDLKRVAVGVAILPNLVILFVLLIIMKYYIGRTRAATQLADIKKTEADFHRMQQQIAQAKLSALQAQVEPHFLYNTLANVQALTEVDPGSANKMVGHLIEYLRAALPKMRESASTVGQEIDLVRSYLNILQMRMGKRLTFVIDVPEDLRSIAFPPLMLPSLVENAIKHGLEPQREGGTVTIAARASGGTLILTVTDTGKGLSDGPAATAGSGVGLDNLRERLAGIYGVRGTFTLEAEAPRGTRATVTVPVTLPTLATESTVRPAMTASFNPATLTPTKGAPSGRAERALAALGSTERTWRRILSWSFLFFVATAAISCVVFLVAVYLGIIPLNFGGSRLTGPAALPLAIPVAALLFAVLVILAGLLVAVGYGLGWLILLLLVSIPIFVIASILPALLPFLIVGGFLGWWAWRTRRKRALKAAGT